MIPGLPQVGGTELIILLVMVLLFVGTKRIPSLARSLGGGIREFRKGASGHYEEEFDQKDKAELIQDEKPSLEGEEASLLSSDKES